MSGIDPVTLQVMIGGLRAACDEMGAALIRSAHSANIKERHDCSTALFDAARRARHAGRAHPRPPRLDAGRGRRGARRGAAARRGLDPQRPLPRRHPPARHHPDLAGLRRRGAARLRRQPRPPRRRRRPDPGRDAGRLAHARGGGRRDPADPGRRRGARASSPRRCAPRASASPTCAPSAAANRIGERRLRRARRAPRRRDRCATGWPRSSPTPSAAPGPPSPSSPTAPTRPRTCSRTTPTASERDVTLRVAATIDGDTPPPRLQRHRRAGRRQPQLPALGDEVGGLLRGPRPDRPRRAAVGRRPPPDRGHRAGGLPAQRPLPAAVAAGNVETSSRVADLVIAALGRRPPGPRPGPGDDEQPDPRRRATSPTTRRSAAARAPAPTPTARARSTSRCRTR